MKEIALDRGRVGYGAGAVVLQAMLLAGCDKAPEQTRTGGDALQAGTADPTSQPTPTTPAPVAGPERLILAFGDSLYAGYGLSRGQSLPDALQRRLRADGINARIVNAGVSGDTTAAGRQRLAFSLKSLPRKPDLVLLGLGGNDVLRQIPPAETRVNMVAMLDELAKRDIPVMLTGMQAPPNLGPDYVKPFDAIWPELATRYKAELYPFILDGVIGNAALMQQDRVHPKAAGVERIADRVTPLLVKRLQAAP